MTTKLKGSQIKVEDIVSNPALSAGWSSTSTAPSEIATYALVSKYKTLLINAVAADVDSSGHYIFELGITSAVIQSRLNSGGMVFVIFEETCKWVFKPVWILESSQLTLCFESMLVDPADSKLKLVRYTCTVSGTTEQWHRNVIYTCQ